MTKYRTVRIEQNGKTKCWRVFKVDSFGTNIADISDHETEQAARTAISRLKAAERKST